MKGIMYDIIIVYDKLNSSRLISVKIILKCVSSKTLELAQ